jgi:hypothetical protein
VSFKTAVLNLGPLLNQSSTLPSSKLGVLKRAPSEDIDAHSFLVYRHIIFCLFQVLHEQLFRSGGGPIRSRLHYDLSPASWNFRAGHRINCTRHLISGNYLKSVDKSPHFFQAVIPRTGNDSIRDYLLLLVNHTRDLFAPKYEKLAYNLLCLALAPAMLRPPSGLKSASNGFAFWRICGLWLRLREERLCLAGWSGSRVPSSNSPHSPDLAVGYRPARNQIPEEIGAVELRMKACTLNSIQSCSFRALLAEVGHAIK